MKELSIKMEKKNESTEVLFAHNDVDVVISYYWDSHGKLVEFDGPNGLQKEELHADTVKIMEHTYEVDMVSDPISEWILYINNERIKCDVVSYNLRKRLFIKAVVGWG